MKCIAAHHPFDPLLFHGIVSRSLVYFLDCEVVLRLEPI